MYKNKKIKKNNNRRNFKMEFFEKIGKKASETYKSAAEKTSKVASETKLKMKIGDCNSQIKDLYKEIGKKVYEKIEVNGKSEKTDFIEDGQPCIHYGQLHTAFDISTKTHLTTIPSELYKNSILASKGDVLLALTSEDVEGSCKSTAWLGN